MTKFNFEKKLNKNNNVRNTHNYFEYKGEIYMKKDFIKKDSGRPKYDRKSLKAILQD